MLDSPRGVRHFIPKDSAALRKFADAHGLRADDYLRDVLGLTNTPKQEHEGWQSPEKVAYLLQQPSEPRADGIAPSMEYHTKVFSREPPRAVET